MKPNSVKPIRCAIYTRVSTDQGLDQEFNSLDAQYDASAAYIKSQAHAGWTLIKARYDDGRYSGGSTDRPALRRLLDDIRARKIDVIVVGTRGGIPFERGTLFYLLRNRFYIGEIRYKGEILPGEQTPFMDRALFDAVQQKLTDQWTARTRVRNAGDHLLTGLLFDDAGHRMAPTHATKGGIRYRYCVSLPCLHGEAKTAKVGSVTRVPAADIEDVVLKSLNEHFRNQSGMPATAITGHSAIAEMIDRIDVYKDRLAIRLRSRESPGTTKLADDIEEPTDDRPLSIPWRKPPSKRFRQILLPPWLLAKGGPTGAAGTTPSSGQRHRTR